MKRLSRNTMKVVAIPAAALVMILAMGPVCDAYGSKATVQLSARNSVDGNVVRLGDIARITGGDSALIRRLKKVVLGDAPAPGKSKKIADRHIRLKLKQHDFNLTRVRLLMPRHIVISRASAAFSEETVKKAVVDFIRGKLPWDESNINISNIRIRGSIKLPKGKITYKIVPPKRNDLLGTVRLPVHFYRNGAQVEKVVVTARVEVLTEVLVAGRPLARHQEIEPGAVRLKKVKLSRSSSDIILDMDMLTGKRAKRKIKQGDILKTNMFEMPPLVNRGDIVVIVARSGGLRITTLGKAKGKGGRGEKIQVQNLESRKYIQATVIDDKTVKVDI